MKTDPSSPAGASSPAIAGGVGGGIGIRHLGALVMLWLAGSIILLLFRPGYGFPPFELLDSWIYTSYKWDLRGQIADFGPTYYGSRLSWILPGALLNSFLPPIAAEICFKLLFSGLFSAACATIVYRAVGLRAACVAVALSLFAPQIIVALHADYVDTPVIVYAALTLACITVARDSRRWVAWIFLGGCFFAAMLVANLSSIGAPGLGIAVFHLVWLRWGFKRQLVCVGLYLLAIATVIAVIGWISVWAGGAFYFLKPQVGMVLYFHDLKANPWTRTNWSWLYGATWLVLPPAALLWGTRGSVAKPAGGDAGRRLIQALTAGLFVSFAWAIQIELKGVEVLSLYYYASYHLCFALPLLAALCYFQPDGARGSLIWTGLLISSLCLFSLLGKALYGWRSLIPFHRFLHTPESLPFLFASVFLLVGLLGSLKIVPAAVRRWCRAELLVFGLIVCTTFTGFHGREISDRLQERFALVYKANHLINREYPRGSYIFWIHPQERNGISLSSTKLWGYRMFTMALFPELGEFHFTDRTIIVPCPLGTGTECLSAAAKSLATAGLELVHSRVIPVVRKSGIGMDLISFSLQRVAVDPAHPPTGVKPLVMLMDFLSAGPRAYTRQLGWIILNPSKGRFLDLSPGYPVFTPTSPGDHLATQYQMCAPARADQSRELSIVTVMPHGGNCRCEVQDQKFRHILDIDLVSPGRMVHRATLPPDSTSLRVVFRCPDVSSTPLPTHLQIYEVPE